MDFDTVLKFRMEFLHSLGIKNENKSVRGLERKLDNEECKVNHSRLDVRRKSGKSEAIILFQLGKNFLMLSSSLYFWSWSSLLLLIFFVSLKAHVLSFRWSAGSGGFLE